MMKTDKQTTFINGLIEGSVDPQVYQDVHRTFARETVSFMSHGNLSFTNTNTKIISRVQFTECEISPFHKHDIDCSHLSSLNPERLPSKNRFADKKMALDTIQTFLLTTFSPGESGHRPYPSAGGLYPVEPLVFLFQDKITDYGDLISGCYHFRPISKKLQLIKKLDCEHFYKKMLHDFAGDDARYWPAFCVMYVGHVGKSIFKYRYRGYRHALMEAGAMYQQSTNIAQQMDLRTTVWSTFSEPQMLYELGLDHGTYLPLTMQLFGYGA